MSASPDPNQCRRNYSARHRRDVKGIGGPVRPRSIRHLPFPFMGKGDRWPTPAKAGGRADGGKGKDWAPSLRLSLSTTRSSAGGPPLPLRGKGSPQRRAEWLRPGGG